MPIDTQIQPMSQLPEHARIPTGFTVTSIFDVVERADGKSPIQLVERTLKEPWIKDYDAIPGNRLCDVLGRFDLSNWGLIAAISEGRRVGGAVIAFDTPEVDMLEGRRDLAVLWDLRIAPEMRGQGIGFALCAAAVEWSRDRHCAEIRVETQNINVPACRLYAGRGFELKAVDRAAYPECPDEIQLLWQKPLNG